MQKIEYKESPSPHVIIENFLSEPSARECLAEAQWLEPVFVPASVSGTPHVEDGDECDECTLQIKNLKLSIRSNDVVYLDDHYKGKRSKSVILTQLEFALQTHQFLNAFKNYLICFL